MAVVRREYVTVGLVAMASAAAAWALKTWLDQRRSLARRHGHREALSRWENEGGSPAAVGNRHREASPEESQA